MKKRVLIAVIYTFLACILVSSVSALLTCTIKASCGGGEVDYGGLAVLNNSHYEQYNETNYANRICCSSDTAVMDNLCTGSGDNIAFIRTADYTNAHVEMANMSTGIYFDVCMGASSGTLLVDYSKDSGACLGRDTCMMTLQNYTNAHVSDCGANAFNISVCVTHVSAAVPEFNAFTMILALSIVLVGGYFIRRKSRR